MKYLLSFFLVHVTLLLYSQQFSLEKSQEHEEKKNSFISELIGNNSGTYYALRNKAGLLEFDFLIEEYDEKFNLKKSLPINFDVLGKEIQILEATEMIKGQLYLFASAYDKNEKTRTLYYTQWTGQEKLSWKELLSFKAEFYAGSVYYYVSFSPDRSKVLVNVQEEPSEGKIKNTFYCYDNELKLLWKKEAPFTDHAGAIVFSDNEGNIFIRTYRFEKVKFAADKIFYEFYTYKANEDKFNPVKIDLGNKFPVSQSVQVYGNYYYGAGFFSDSLQRNKYGTYFFKLNRSTLVVEDFGFNLFSKDDVRYLAKEETLDKQPGIPYEYHDIDLLVLEDRVALISENSYDGYHEIGDNKDYYWGNNDLLISQWKGGNSVIYTHIPKKQENAYMAPKSNFLALSKRPYYYQRFSAVCTALNDKLILFYNESPKNLSGTISPDKWKIQGKNSEVAPVAAIVDKDGKYQTKVIINTSEKVNENIALKPLTHLVLAPNNLLLVGERKNNVFFINLNIKP